MVENLNLGILRPRAEGHKPIIIIIIISSSSGEHYLIVALSLSVYAGQLGSTDCMNGIALSERVLFLVSTSASGKIQGTS
jgi:ABC-type spermidine/putrescine transport system permease subunit II